jgi:cytochrome P450
MGRTTTGLVTLHNGSQLPKGSCVGVAPLPMYDSSMFEDPSKFDGYRFLKKRQTRINGKLRQLRSSLASDMLHACPGRFFAGNELKVALPHLLLKYDWKMPEGESRPRLVDPPGNSSER